MNGTLGITNIQPPPHAVIVQPKDPALREGGPILAIDEQGRVANFGDRTLLPQDAELVDGRGLRIRPGLIDIHVHGGGGFDLMTDDPEQVRILERPTPQ